MSIWGRLSGATSGLAEVDCTEMLCGLVLLDVIGKRELRATDRCLLVETISRARQTNATRLRWSA